MANQESNPSSENGDSDVPPVPVSEKSWSPECAKATFDLATALVFNNIDQLRGLALYRQLATAPVDTTVGAAESTDLSTDGMVATGVCLVDGLSVFDSVDVNAPTAANRAREDEGVQWLCRAVERGSPQGNYELGSVVYRGLGGVVDEDEEASFRLFERAAVSGHVAGTFMVADCLLDGVGCEVDVVRAIPLLYFSAERGHRYARQRMQQLLDNTK